MPALQRACRAAPPGRLTSVKRFVFRLLCIVLLLAGQQAALTHALAHAQDRVARSAATHAEGSGPAPAKQGERYALCDFDYAYSQVLGALHSACVPPIRLDVSFYTVAAYADGITAPTDLPFLIRGPPQAL